MIRPLSRTPGTQGGRESRSPLPHADGPCTGSAQLAFWAEGGEHGEEGRQGLHAERSGGEGRSHPLTAQSLRWRDDGRFLGDLSGLRSYRPIAQMGRLRFRQVN